MQQKRHASLYHSYIAYRTLGDPAVSLTFFPKLARRYDFKIRVLYISKWFF